MSGVNKVIIIGHLGRDPEVSAVGQTSVTRLNVATSESWMDKNNQKQERTEWHRISVWGKVGENCAKYLTKGKQVYVEGKLQTRSWEDNGVKKYATDITASTVQFLSPSSAGGGNQQQGGGNFNPTDFGPEPSFNTNEEIPF